VRSDETITGSIAFGPGRRKTVTILDVVRNSTTGDIRAGRLDLLRLREIVVFESDPTARLVVEGIIYTFALKRDGTFTARRVRKGQ
jgi:hypothetical protein